MVFDDTQILYPPFYIKRVTQFVCLQTEFSNPKTFSEIGEICKCEPHTSFQDFIVHLNRHHRMSQDQSTWACTVCETVFTCQDLYTNHQQFCKTVETTSSDENLVTSVNKLIYIFKRRPFSLKFIYFFLKPTIFLFLSFQTSDSWTPVLNCTVCDTEWKSRAEFSQHFKTSHQKPTLDLFNCQVCDKNFAKKCHLISHKKTAQHYIIDDIVLPRSQPFECSWCNFQAVTMLEVQVHYNKHHSLLKYGNPLATLSSNYFKTLPTFICPYTKCKTKTHSKDLMRSHFYYVHKSPATFETFLQNLYTTCIHCKAKIRNTSFKLHFNWCKNIQRE
jgi:hypothetical protein